MPQATGATTKILGLTETEFNTVPAVPDAQVLYVRTMELNYNAPREQDPTLAGGFRGQEKIPPRQIATMIPRGEECIADLGRGFAAVAAGDEVPTDILARADA